MLRVFISGPIKADTVAKELENVHVALEAAYSLVKAGFAVYLPHAFWFVDEYMNANGWVPLKDNYIPQDLEWLAKSDILLRLPGKSRGCDIEMKHAVLHDIHYCYSVDEVLKFSKELQKGSCND